MTTKTEDHVSRGSFFTAAAFYKILKEALIPIDRDRGADYEKFPDVLLVDEVVFNAMDKFNTEDSWKATTYGYNLKNLTETTESSKEDKEASEKLHPIFERTHGVLGQLRIHPETKLNLEHPDFVTWLSDNFTLNGPIRPGSQVVRKKNK